MTGWPTCGSHDLLLYASDAELVSATVPFVRTGLTAGDLVVVHGDENTLGLLRAALDDEPRVRFVPDLRLYRTPNEAVAAVEQMLIRETRGVRIAGLNPYPAQAAYKADWLRFEALVSAVLLGHGIHAMCGYDTRVLSAELIAAGELTHTHVVTPSGRMPNPLYEAPDAVLGSLSSTDARDPMESTPPTLVVSDVTDLVHVRHDVHLAVMRSVLPVATAEAFVAAFHEVATNALQHGRPPVQVRLWANADWVHCAVADRGPGIADPFLGYGSPQRSSAVAPMGLWIARQCCDELTMSTRPRGGLNVRLSVGVGGPGVRPEDTLG